MAEASDDQFIFRWIRKPDNFRGFFKLGPLSKSINVQASTESMASYQMNSNFVHFDPQDEFEFEEQFENIFNDK